MTILLLLIPIIFVLIFYTISWGVARSMTMDYTKEYGKCSYEVFVRYFENTEWRYDDLWKNSFFTNSAGTQIHASIYTFDNKGMLFGYFDYARVLLYLNSKRKSGYKKDLWK